MKASNPKVMCAVKVYKNEPVTFRFARAFAIDLDSMLEKNPLVRNDSRMDKIWELYEETLLLRSNGFSA